MVSLKVGRYSIKFLNLGFPLSFFNYINSVWDLSPYSKINYETKQENQEIRLTDHYFLGIKTRQLLSESEIIIITSLVVFTPDELRRETWCKESKPPKIN